MREFHQTPKKFRLLLLSSNRKPKSISSQSKKLNHPQQKIVKKSVSSVYALITENDAVLDLSEKESSQISSISASVDDHHSNLEVSANGVMIQHPEVLAGISSVSDAFVTDEDQSSESGEIVRKSLSSVFTPITENNVVSDISGTESIQISTVSESVDDDQSTMEVSDNSVSLQHPEVSLGSSSLLNAFVSDENQSSESVQSYIGPLNQFISPSSVTSGLVKRSPLSSITTVEMTPSSSPITTEDATVFDTCDGATTKEMKAFKMESLEKHLRESMFQVWHSADIEPKHKMFLDELSTMLIEGCYGLHEERGIIADMFSRKETIPLLSFVLGIVAVSTCFFLFSVVESSYYGPPST